MFRGSAVDVDHASSAIGTVDDVREEIFSRVLVSTTLALVGGDLLLHCSESGVVDDAGVVVRHRFTHRTASPASVLKVLVGNVSTSDGGTAENLPHVPSLPTPRSLGDLPSRRCPGCVGESLDDGPGAESCEGQVEDLADGVLASGDDLELLLLIVEGEP